MSHRVCVTADEEQGNRWEQVCLSSQTCVSSAAALTLASARADAEELLHPAPVPPSKPEEEQFSAPGLSL